MINKSLVIGIILSLVIHLGLMIPFAIGKQDISVKNSAASLVVSVTSLEPVNQQSESMTPKIANRQSGEAGVVEKKKVELIGTLAPEYPWRSRMNNEEGSVEMIFFVNDLGQAVNIKVAKSSGFENLDDAAVDAVKKARFANASESLEEMRMSLNFKLKEKNGI